ncbi:MAG: hypothetical protein IJ314_01510 [Bacteroidales bacterium]|nr:hypothetical protein [Bacteroidales bacterium]
MEEKNMKTNFIALCAFALSLVALSSCNKADVETVEPQGQEVKFKVFSEETKAYLASGITNWSNDDYIYVLDQEGKWYNSSKLASGTVVEAEFTFPTFPANPTYALFVGANNSETLGIEDGQVTANLISEQSISNNNSFGKNANLTIGEVVKVDETTYSASLKNVCGLLKFSVPAGITSVKIEGNNGEILSGVVYIDYNEGQPEWTAKEGVKEVTVIPRKSSENYTAGTYYACVLPQTFEEGITVTLTDVNGYTAQTNGSNPLTLGRNKVVELQNLNVPEAPQQEPTVLEFDFTGTNTFPAEFPSGTNNAAIFTDPIRLTDSKGIQYGFTCSGAVCKASSSSTGLCFVLQEAAQTMTFPVIDGKTITGVTVFGGNSSAKAVYLKDADGNTVSAKGLPSATESAVLTPNDGRVATSLYNNGSSTYISKLILTYK